MRLLVEDLAVVTHHPDTGAGEVLPAPRDLMYEGAVLIELIAAGCAELAYRRNAVGGEVPRIDLSPPPTPLDALLARAHERGVSKRVPAHAHSVMDRLGKGLIRELRTRLVEAGIWRERRRRVLLVPFIAYPATDPEDVRSRRSRLAAVARGEEAGTERDRVLVALLAARSDGLRGLVGKDDLRAARARIRDQIDPDSVEGRVHRVVRARSSVTPPVGG